MKLMILDGNSVVNRAFYGVRPLSTREGICTNAIYGFLNILEKLRSEEAPDALCVAFDLKAPTFRHLRYEGYKATRHPMSFSGLKTAALNLIHTSEQRGETLDIPSLCASFSKAVSEMLVPRVAAALEETGYRKLAIAGGVAANSRIRRDFEQLCRSRGAALYAPPLSLCGDNGAMASVTPTVCTQ